MPPSPLPHPRLFSAPFFFRAFWGLSGKETQRVCHDLDVMNLAAATATSSTSVRPPVCPCSGVSIGAGISHHPLARKVTNNADVYPGARNVATYVPV
ncbi:hypothetical protein GGS23DRAFT_518940 [Durotheca rogersii]|uniref:uncharacterized protein n=1 Tax=Durotheca rogersii TaxID=419775 RepID=UPI0022207BFB|nr:uncharacterized protein GGS23DRAFT_518940 [Durotheca rogersii]KAI5863895.1 hypothetical protein GGS23DRAFT_518940 [Durotheca rogersii]